MSNRISFSIARARPFALRSLTGATLLACALSTQAQTAQTHTYDLPAQALGSTLARIASEHGQQISIDAELVRGLSAPAVRGQLTAEQAARAALAGSGLELVTTGGGNWALRRLPAGERQPAASATPATTLGEVRVTAQAERSGVTEGSGTYTANAITIGKMPLALKDTPQSVTVVSRQQIEEQNLIGVDDALRYATGITTESWYGEAIGIKSRGFDITDFRYDGGGVTEQGSRSYTFLSDLIGFDHVEVLRGADSLSAGAGIAGGSVNLVRKRPTAERQVLWNARAGSWNHWRGELDAGGPINEAGTLRGRVALALEGRDYFYDNADAHKQVVYGVIEADLTPDTLLSVGLTHERRKATPWMGGIPRSTDGGLLGVPRSTSYVYDWNRLRTNITDAFVKLEHDLSPAWKLNLNLTHRKEASRYYVGVPGFTGSIVDRGTGIASSELNIWNEAIDAKQTTIDANLNGSFNWGGRKHHVQAGLDWTDYELSDIAANAFGVADVDFRHFDPGSYPYPNLPQFPANDWSPWLYAYDKLGAYASGRFEVADGTHLIVGGRLNNIDGSDKVDRRVLTPYGGLTYALDAQHTVYASVSELFQAQNNRLDANRVPLKPMTGRNHEIGAKGEWWNGRLNGSVALYQIERTGEAVKVPDTQSPCCFVARGKVVSKGVDLELSGAITPRWNLTAGYTHNRNVNKQDDLPFDSVTPRHLFKLWTAYQLPDALSNWKIGGGLVSQSRFQSSGFELPGYTVASAFAEYRINPKMSLSLNIGNLFDRTYFHTEGWYGEPRSVMVSLRGRF